MIMRAVISLVAHDMPSTFARHSASRMGRQPLFAFPTAPTMIHLPLYGTALPTARLRSYDIAPCSFRRYPVPLLIPLLHPVAASRYCIPLLHPVQSLPSACSILTFLHCSPVYLYGIIVLLYIGCFSLYLSFVLCHVLMLYFA